MWNGSLICDGLAGSKAEKKSSGFDKPDLMIVSLWVDGLIAIIVEPLNKMASGVGIHEHLVGQRALNILASRRDCHLILGKLWYDFQAAVGKVRGSRHISGLVRTTLDICRLCEA